MRLQRMGQSMKRPLMGWNSYDYYDTTVNEEQVRANAEYMAEHLKDYGWEYVVIDIAWYSKEAGQKRDRFQYVPFALMDIDEYSRLLPDENRFPSAKDGRGFAPLAEYVHSLGLKFGIHIMRGIPRRAAYLRTAIKNTSVTANEIADPNSICFWNPDMYGVNPKAEGAQEYYDSLLELYAQWGVDFIKCDDICRMDAASSRAEIEMLHKAIEKCGRDIVLSLSPGPAIVEEQAFYHENANMWRITDDFWDDWKLLLDMFDRCKKWQPYVKDGGYPDCDMLPVGRLGKGFGEERTTRFTFEEQKTMLTLWCIFRSPLMIGAELTLLDEETKSLFTNRALYEMQKNIRFSREVYRDADFIVWMGSADDQSYVAIFNISDNEAAAPIEIVKKTDPETAHKYASGNGVEIWSGKPADLTKGWTIPSHGALLFAV